MAKKRIFSLDPDQLERLLSIGTGAEDPAKEQEQRRRDDEGNAVSGEKPPPKKKEETENAGAPISIVFEQPGDEIGPYKLLRILGEGGMGIAYLAEQESPIKRQVALKVIKPGMDTRRVIARFEAERQALALLDHPNIAHIYDAGTTDPGRPYFAMEYVEGLPITEHCDRHKLTIEDRLNLFRQVCLAVHHAHQKSIIHRDIKPSNILVSYQDDLAVPKIIDFGVAKALNQPLTERKLFTEQGQLFGTPEYMSPEQADMVNEDIDTRSDIYSLGVLLYVLLTGALPFDAKALREGGIEHIRQVIRETDPKTPSTRLSSLGEEAKKVAESRRIEVAALAKRLHKELEWIPLKAMRKERTERYRSASELADDVENYLKGAALIAGPPSTAYRLKKFIRRNRVLVAGIATVLAVLIIGIVASTIFAVGQARARAEAQAVSDFLQKSVLRSLDLWDMRGKEITVRSILDTASQGLEGKLAGEPLVEASIRWTLAASYTWLGLYEPAELHAKRALEIRRAQLGADHLATLLSVYELGWLYFYQSRYNEAGPLLANALEDMELVLNEEHEARMYCMATLGWVYNMQGRFPEAEQLFERGLATVHRVWGEENEHSPTFLQGLGFAYQMQDRYEEAERLFNRGLEISRRVRGEQDWETLNLMRTFGELCRELGRYDQAEQLLVEALDGKRRVLREQHSSTLETMGSLGWLYHSQGRYDQAESLFVKALETGRRVVGEAHMCSLYSMHGLGTLYVSQGRYDQAEPLLAKALKIERRVLGEENWATLEVMNTLAELCTIQGRYAEAEKLYGKTLEAQRRVLGDEHPHTLASVNGLALLRMKQGHFDDANDLFHEALKGRQRELGDDHPDTLETKNDLAVLYKEQARYDKAEPLLLESLEGRRKVLGEEHPDTLVSLNNLIELYEAWGKPEKAEEWRKKLRIAD